MFVLVWRFVRCPGIPEEGKTIEDFRLSHNLMIDLIVSVDAQSCLAYIAKEQVGADSKG